MHSLLSIELSRTLAQEKSRRSPMLETRTRRPKLAQLFRTLLPRGTRHSKAATAAGARRGLA